MAGLKACATGYETGSAIGHHASATSKNEQEREAF
jgi:hypothetical protein